MVISDATMPVGPSGWVFGICFYYRPFMVNYHRTNMALESFTRCSQLSSDAMSTMILLDTRLPATTGKPASKGDIHLPSLGLRFDPN